jgi:hypothetical protein
LRTAHEVPYRLGIPPAGPCAGAGALSPEKGGALRTQSTQGRRIVVVAGLCGGLFGAPLLLLHNGPTHAQHASGSVRALASRVLPPSRLDDVQLPSHLVAYSAPVAPITSPSVAASVTPVTSPPAPVETTTTTVARPVPVIIGNTEHGQATWYSEAPPGTCASPTLPFGTVLTVTNLANGASTRCTVEDREGAGYPRVVDMSYSGFSQIADPSLGVVDVTISW